MSYKNFFKKMGGIFDYRKPSKSSTMDILVVKSKSGEFRSSSFHIDFGWKVLRPSNKEVDILVNGEKLDIKMKLNKQGKGYFEIFCDPIDTMNWSTDNYYSEDEMVPFSKLNKEANLDESQSIEHDNALEYQTDKKVDVTEEIENNKTNDEQRGYFKQE